MNHIKEKGQRLENNVPSGTQQRMFDKSAEEDNLKPC